MENNETSSFDVLAIVELFGRKVIAGRVTEQTIAGRGFFRVDVPAVDDREGFTKYYHPDATYGITPTDEDTMMRVVRGLREEPVEVWRLRLPEQVNTTLIEEDDGPPF